MKRMVSILLSAALLLSLLGACREDTPPVGTEWTAANLSEIAFQFSGFEASNEFEHLYIDHDRERLAVYIENAYGLEEPWEDAAVSRAIGASAFEIAVLRMADEKSAVRAATALMSYIFTRQGDFAGYAPAEADMVANGSIMQDGPFVALFICPDPEGAYAVVEAALSGEYDPDAPEPSQEIINDVKGLRDFLVANRGMENANLELLDNGSPEALAAYIEKNYGLTQDQWAECAIARDLGSSAFEVAVFGSANDWERIWDVAQMLDGYLDAREAQFDSGTEQAALLHRAITVVTGEYIVMLACEDPEGTAGAFAGVSGAMGYSWSSRYQYLDTDPNFPDRCAYTPPNEDDMSIYDTSAILAAWEGGDPAALSEYDRKIYDRAQEVLNEILADGMSGYEKEVAVYSWVVQNVDYDWTHQDVLVETPRESFTPYGGLVNHTAVCLGYATTFQLLMDLAGVECITVTGAARMSSSDHGWNMVRLNGQWYCVDVTWDANMREMGGLGRQKDWNYFNVTSDYMADTDHQWDYAGIPEATAEDQGRG